MWEFDLQGDPHEESPHAIWGSCLQMCYLRCQLCHPKRILNPHENGARKRWKSHKIRMPHSQLRFSNWKARGACGPCAFGPPQPGKRSLTGGSLLIPADPPVRPLWSQFCGWGKVDQPHDQPLKEWEDQENVWLKLRLSPLSKVSGTLFKILLITTVDQDGCFDQLIAGSSIGKDTWNFMYSLSILKVN